LVRGLAGGVTPLWAGQIEDDGGLVVGIELVLDGGEGAEEQAADVGEDGGVAGCNAILSEEVVEFGEGLVDAFGGLEAAGFAREGGGEVGVLFFVLALGDVAGT
jgi:hypothetical protein